MEAPTHPESLGKLEKNITFLLRLGAAPNSGALARCAEIQGTFRFPGIDSKLEPEKRKRQSVGSGYTRHNCQLHQFEAFRQHMRRSNCEVIKHSGGVL
jgi:hypothetical protein